MMVKKLFFVYTTPASHPFGAQEFWGNPAFYTDCVPPGQGYFGKPRSIFNYHPIGPGGKSFEQHCSANPSSHLSGAQEFWGNPAFYTDCVPPGQGHFGKPRSIFNYHPTSPGGKSFEQQCSANPSSHPSEAQEF
jgi:hypothetical protein